MRSETAQQRAQKKSTGDVLKVVSVLPHLLVEESVDGSGQNLRRVDVHRQPAPEAQLPLVVPAPPQNLALARQRQGERVSRLHQDKK